MIMFRVPVIGCLLLVTAAFGIGAAQDKLVVDTTIYYDQPLEKWSIHLTNNDGSWFPDPNAVIVSPDGGLVYVTFVDGRLEVLEAANGKSHSTYIPEPVGPRWSTICRSGVTFGTTSSGDTYIVYSVTDISPSGVSHSRLIAFSHPRNELLWKSSVILGEIQGEVAITQRPPFQGEYIVFTHNYRIDDGARDQIGTFSMVQASTGEVLFSEMAGSSPDDPLVEDVPLIDSMQLPYAPVGHAPMPEAGRYPTGKDNSNDLFIWGTSAHWGWGGGPVGYTRAFQLPTDFDPNSTSMLKTSLLKSNRWNTRSKPIFNYNGMNLYFGVRENKIRGWTGGPNFDALANLVQNNLGRNLVPDNEPVAHAMLLSNDESYLFVTPSTSDPAIADRRVLQDADSSQNPSRLACLDAINGTIIWKIDGLVRAASTPSITPDDALLLSTFVDGSVMAVEPASGSIFWNLTCSHFEASHDLECDFHFILAHSSLSPSGLVYFYADPFGNIRALQIGESTSPTPAPTDFPTQIPTFSTTAAPIASSSSPSCQASGFSGVWAFLSLTVVSFVAAQV